MGRYTKDDYDKLVNETINFLNKSLIILQYLQLSGDIENKHF